nr:hypothetical protein [Mucilaginibacter sp. X5P1]
MYHSVHFLSSEERENESKSQCFKKDIGSQNLERCQTAVYLRLKDWI